MKNRFGFAVVVIFCFVIFIAPSLHSSRLTEELEGTLEVIMATETGQKTCQPLYFINASGKR
ncbi:MAG: hypothetical protein AAB962_03375, partial [Patescibacteria group bacterium]